MSNALTLQSYELGLNEYIAKTPDEVSGNLKVWIDQTLGLLSKQPRIIEIGSAFGRDSCYMETQGFQVQRTDATQGFVDLLQNKGYSALLFNILTDDFESTYDLIFANAVFLHFTPLEFQKVLKKVRAALSYDGILSFSVKRGEGEEWTSAKVGHPRYFCYWQPQSIQSLLESSGFDGLAMSENKEFLLLFVKRKES